MYLSMSETIYYKLYLILNIYIYIITHTYHEYVVVFHNWYELSLIISLLAYTTHLGQGLIREYLANGNNTIQFRRQLRKS